MAWNIHLIKFCSICLGAGKTTTLQILTAEFPPTSGDATLAGFSVRNEPEKTRRRIGYCPQASLAIIVELVITLVTLSYPVL